LTPPAGEWRTILAFCDGRWAGDTIRLFGAPAWIFVWDCVASWPRSGRPLQRMKLCFWYGQREDYRDFGRYGDPAKYPSRHETPGHVLSDLYVEQLPAFHARAIHAHQKPEDWIRCLIQNTHREGDILDPYLGAGTSLIAAESIGLRCFGMERDPRLVAWALDLATQRDLAVERLE